EAARAQLLAERGGAPILPHDGAVHRPAAPPLPEDGGLALVRDAERRHVARAYPRAPARLAEHAQRDPPDLVYIVLDPPRLRVVLRELRVGAPDDAPLAVEHEHGRPRGPLIDRDDDGHRLLAEEERAPASQALEDERLQALAHLVAEPADARGVGGAARTAPTRARAAPRRGASAIQSSRSGRARRTACRIMSAS